MSQPDQLVAALAELAEAMAALSARLGREAELRLGLDPLTPAQRAILAGLTTGGDASAAELSTSLNLPVATVRAGLAELERRGLAVHDSPSERARLAPYRATATAQRLRDVARERAVYHLGYALAPMSPADRTALEQATDALAGLALALAPPPPHHGARASQSGEGASGWSSGA